MFRRISDSTIVDGIRLQDDQILNWLYDNYHETVRHHVLKNSGSESDVPDVFQEAIITLYRQINSDGFSLTTDLRGYFYGIARNIWNAQLRKKMRNTEIDRDYPDNEEGDDPGLLLESIVSRAFRKLSDDSQTILSLFSEGYSYQEIALKMNLKSETYARRKKYLSKEALMELVKSDPEYKNYLDLR